MAPELLTPSGEFCWDAQVTTASDVWSLGVSFFAVLFGFLPVHKHPHERGGENPLAKAKKLCKEEWSEADSNTRKLVTDMMAWSATKRPPISAVVARLTKCCRQAGHKL